MSAAEDTREPPIPKPRQRRGQPASPTHSRTRSSVQDAPARRSPRVATMAPVQYDDDTSDAEVDGDTTGMGVIGIGKKEDPGDDDTDAADDSGEGDDSIAPTKTSAPLPDEPDYTQAFVIFMTVATALYVVYIAAWYLTSP